MPKGIQVTERDKAIIQGLLKVGVLTTTQIQQAFFPNVSLRVVQERLRKLHVAKLLTPFSTSPYVRSQPRVWQLSTSIKKRSQGNDVVQLRSEYLINHQLGLNQIFCDLCSFLQRESWVWSWEDGSIFSYSIGTKILRPDARIIFGHGQRVVLLEYDRGTKSVQKVRERLRLYERWSRTISNPKNHLLIYAVPTALRGQAIEKKWKEIEQLRAREASSFFNFPNFKFSWSLDHDTYQKILSWRSIKKIGSTMIQFLPPNLQREIENHE